MQGGWYLALPTYFVSGPEGLYGTIVLFCCSAFLIAKRDRGWPMAFFPTIWLAAMLFIIGLIGPRQNYTIQYAIILGATIVALCLAYWSFRSSNAKIVRIFVM